MDYLLLYPIVVQSVGRLLFGCNATVIIFRLTTMAESTRCNPWKHRSDNFTKGGRIQRLDTVAVAVSNIAIIQDSSWYTDVIVCTI